MPAIIPSGAPSVPLRPIPGGGNPAQPSYHAAGGGGEIAQKEFNRLSGNLMQAAFEVQEQAEREASRTLKNQLEKELNDFAEAEVYHPENGALYKRGENAFAARDAVMKKLKTLTEASGKNLTVRDRGWYDAMVNDYTRGLNGKLSAHEAQERRRVSLESSESNMQSWERMSELDATNAPMAMTNLVKEMGAMARNEGWDDKTLGNELWKREAGLHAAVMRGFVARKDWQSAEEYLKRAGARMVPGHAADFAVKIGNQRQDELADAIVDGIFRPSWPGDKKKAGGAYDAPPRSIQEFEQRFQKDAGSLDQKTQELVLSKAAGRLRLALQAEESHVNSEYDYLAKKIMANPQGSARASLEPEDRARYDRLHVDIQKNLNGLIKAPPEHDWTVWTRFEEQFRGNPEALSKLTPMQFNSFLVHFSQHYRTQAEKMREEASKAPQSLKYSHILDIQKAAVETLANIDGVRGDRGDWLKGNESRITRLAVQMEKVVNGQIYESKGKKGLGDFGSKELMTIGQIEADKTVVVDGNDGAKAPGQWGWMGASQKKRRMIDVPRSEYNTIKPAARTADERAQVLNGLRNQAKLFGPAQSAFLEDSTRVELFLKQAYTAQEMEDESYYLHLMNKLRNLEEP